MQGARLTGCQAGGQLAVTGAAPPSGYLRNSRAIVLLAVGALLLLLALRIGGNPRLPGAIGLVAWTVQALPLLALAPGLLGSRPRAYAWLGFLIQFYFIHAVLIAFTPTRLGWGLAQIFLCLVIFGALIAFIRRFRRDHALGP